MFVLFSFTSITKALKLRSCCACSIVLFNSSLISPSSSSSFFFFVHDLEYTMVKYFLSFLFSSLLSLTSPFILIIDRGQQFFALSLTRKRAVRTTLRNRYFVFKNKYIYQQATSFVLLPLPPQVIIQHLNAIRRDGEYIRLIAAQPLAKKRGREKK